jgi:hypothetical protein
MNGRDLFQSESKALPTRAVPEDRRRARRAKVALLIGVRPYNADSSCFEQIHTTANVSRDGIYFTYAHGTYGVGMHLLVTCPYSGSRTEGEGELARVLRADSRADGSSCVALIYVRSIGYYHAKGAMSPQ